MPDTGQCHVQMTVRKRAVRFVDAVLASSAIDEHFGQCLSLRFVVGNRICQPQRELEAINDDGGSRVHAESKIDARYMMYLPPCSECLHGHQFRTDG